MWKDSNKFGLFYVVQTKKQVKKGVTAGGRRLKILKKYLTHNGKTNTGPGLEVGSEEDKDSCRGVYISVLSGFWFWLDNTILLKKRIK